MVKSLENDHGNDYDQIESDHNNNGEQHMQTIKASEFKAKCLHFMDEVNQTGEEIVITKNGKPVSILKPYRTHPATIFGLHKGKIRSNDDLIAPLDIVWNAG